MAFRRESYSIIRIGNLLAGSIKIDRVPILLTNHQIPVKYIKTYAIITDKTIDDSINPEFGKPDYLFKIDDGTGSIWVKSSSFQNEDLNKWDFVRILGSINLDTSNGKDYEVIIEANAIQKVTDHNWALVHILETIRQQKKTKETHGSNKNLKKAQTNMDEDQSDLDAVPPPDENDSTDDSSDMENLAQKIERILRENDTGNGVEFSVIMKNAGEVDESEVDDILFELAYEGKVYQPRPDYYRIMD